jgi:hypothetical protein
MQHPEERSSDTHPFVNYLLNPVMNKRPTFESITAEELATIRTKTQLTCVEYLQHNKPGFFTLYSKKISGLLNEGKEILFLLTKLRSEPLNIIKMILKLHIFIKKGETYRSAYLNYLKISTILTTSNKFDKVLKTDCHNESGRYPISIPLAPLLAQYTNQVYCTEIDESVILDALQFSSPPENCLISRGTITKLAFKDALFDLVLDFSTIDHVTLEECSKALEEYDRVLQSGGFIVIIVWTAKNYSYDEVSKQMFFSREIITSQIKSTFELYLDKNLLTVETSDLVMFVGRKKR